MNGPLELLLGVIRGCGCGCGRERRNNFELDTPRVSRQTITLVQVKIIFLFI